ncbi:hypothetical protein CYMTET_20745 [Cymbomonas tetramitiformis]|uniref:Methyltransferase type 11 domain-containing protein n=1 Tax=Cymbomonas tetramitiformis TaxID=36881 RepID=A0AAE0L3W7_9CHLO|nr:hypothetical protein CYMTET_20745 [Cymbomonas tetramitiformis]
MMMTVLERFMVFFILSATRVLVARTSSLEGSRTKAMLPNSHSSFYEAVQARKSSEKANNHLGRDLRRGNSDGARFRGKVSDIAGNSGTSSLMGAVASVRRSESNEYQPWDTLEDRSFIGLQEGFQGPQYLSDRNDSHAESAAYTGVYDRAWARDYPRLSCWGCQFYGRLTNLVQFHTALDAGTGNGMGVRMLRALGKNAYGIELSGAALRQDSRELLQNNWVRQGSLRKLPYADNQFDAVLSADVLEHLPPDMADEVVSELCHHQKGVNNPVIRMTAAPIPAVG